jgi:hypothetical protein
MDNMIAQYDLHTHSTASDGTLLPAELVARASVAGVSVLALTDHDTTAGLDEAERVAVHLDVQLIPGIEISVSWNKMTVHVVGLGFDRGYEPLQRGLEQLREFRAWRAIEIGRRLDREGIDGAYEGACRHAKGELVSRTHFAHYLVESGRAETVRDVFKRFLVANKPGYVPGEWATLEDSVSWITAAGGQAVIAHPARYKLTRGKLRRLLGDFKALGGEGMEVVSGSHSKDECYTMARHAVDFGLLASAGSDYHGPENPWLELGRMPDMPPTCTPIWRDWPVRVAA